jgi:uncharacterized damage-inducible protein DinB
VAFLLAHLADTGYFGATLPGQPGTNPLSPVLDDARRIDEVEVLPLRGGPTLRGTIAFLMQHESPHVGQMALLRKRLGRPATAYTRRPE